MSSAKSLEMDLRELFRGMDLVVPALMVSDITTHSQRAMPGGLFIACAGLNHHGLDFMPAALAAGVAAIAWEPAEGVAEPHLPRGVTGLEVPDLRARLGTLADRFFRCPSEGLAVAGVTGTNGKTTTAWLVTQALSQLGRTAGYLGTLGYGVYPGSMHPSSLTTPGCVSMHRRIRQMADAGASHLVAEVSSHALDQGRVDGVRFQVAALTNLSRDHLDYHGDMNRYAEAKARLFLTTGIRTAVINIGDGFGAQLAGRLEDGTELISVAVVRAGAGPTGAKIEGRLTGARADGLGLNLSGDYGEAHLASPLWGSFNAENLALSAGLLIALGFSLGDAAAALERCVAPPGRMQVIDAGRDRPRVVVDFAHTPEALGKALAVAREHCRGRVWCVFGCGGDRDPGKRGPMGATATKLADRAVITDDNPRHEDPSLIIDDILAGAAPDARLQVIPDRGAAIGHAINAASPDDVILVAGKGHEAVQIVGDRHRPFSDVDVVRTAMGLGS
jgi:UDP-N-acetylmuramoyl-L-alanyl-D-glutamate--2,6-diaminopimelate ligase